MVKQRHQMARHQLLIVPLCCLMLATREKATHMEVACGAEGGRTVCPHSIRMVFSPGGHGVVKVLAG